MIVSARIINKSNIYLLEFNCFLNCINNPNFIIIEAEDNVIIVI